MPGPISGGSSGVDLNSDQTIAGTKTFSNSVNVGNGGANNYSLFGASQSSHGPDTGVGLYIGNSTSITTQTIVPGMQSVMEFDGASSSDARMPGATLLAATGNSSAGNLIGTTGNTPAGLIGSVNRVYHRGSGTLSRAFGSLANLQSFSTGTITDSAGFFAQNPSVSAVTWGTHSGLWVEGGSISGTITTRYGVRVDTLNGGSTKWGMWIQSDPSFLGGGANLNNQKITNLLDPTTAQDAASKNYIDTLFTAANAPIGVSFQTTKTGIDMKSTGATDIFTVRAGVTGFILTDCFLLTTAVNTATLGPVFKMIESGGGLVIGTSSATTAAGEANWILATGKVYSMARPNVSIVQDFVTCATGNKVQLSVTTGATATTLTATAFVTGYYY